MTRTYIVYYRPRGAEYAFMHPFSIRVTASSKKEARAEAILQIGDVYRVVRVE